MNSELISPLCFSSAFRERNQPSPPCGGHYWHRDWGPACADTAGCRGAFHFPSQVQWHSQMLLLPQADPSPRGRTPHPPISGLDLQDLPTSPQIFSLVLQFLPHLVLTCGSFLNTSFILLFSREVGSISFATPWTPLSMEFPGRNTGVGCHFLLQGIFLAQGSNLGLPHCRTSLYHLRYQGSPIFK